MDKNTIVTSLYQHFLRMYLIQIAEEYSCRKLKTDENAFFYVLFHSEHVIVLIGNPYNILLNKSQRRYLLQESSLKTDKGKLSVRVGRKAMGHLCSDRQVTEVFFCKSATFLQQHPRKFFHLRAAAYWIQNQSIPCFTGEFWVLEKYLATKETYYFLFASASTSHHAHALTEVNIVIRLFRNNGSRNKKHSQRVITKRRI